MIGSLVLLFTIFSISSAILEEDLTEKLHFYFGDTDHRTVRIDGISVRNITSACKYSCNAFLDPDFPFLMGPTAQVQSIMFHVGAETFAGAYTVPCGKISSLPPISFKINGKVVDFGPEQYVWMSTLGEKLTCFTYFYDMDYDQFGAWYLGAPLVKIADGMND